MSVPLVSVVIPCYNCEGSLKDTVQSVLAQTMADFEVIAVDDGSTDGTGALLDALAAQDARITVLHMQNGGVSRARNAGIAKACGTWLAFVDADDLLLADALQTLLALDDARADILCGAYIMRYVDEGGHERHFACPQGDRMTALHSLVRCEGSFNPVYARLYRRAFIVREGIVVPPDVRVGEDVLFNLDAFFAAGSYRACDTPVYLYLYGGDSAMTRARGDAVAKSRAMLEGIGAFMDRTGLNTALFRAHIDVYICLLRKERGRAGAALALRRSMVERITRGVSFPALDTKQKLYYLALRTLPALSYFLP